MELAILRETSTLTEGGLAVFESAAALASHDAAVGAAAALQLSPSDEPSTKMSLLTLDGSEVIDGPFLLPCPFADQGAAATAAAAVAATFCGGGCSAGQWQPRPAASAGESGWWGSGDAAGLWDSRLPPGLALAYASEPWALPAHDRTPWPAAEHAAAPATDAPATHLQGTASLHIQALRAARMAGAPVPCVPRPAGSSLPGTCTYHASAGAVGGGGATARGAVGQQRLAATHDMRANSWSAGSVPGGGGFGGAAGVVSGPGRNAVMARWRMLDTVEEEGQSHAPGHPN